MQVFRLDYGDVFEDMTVSENPWLKMALNNAWANSTLYGALRDLSSEDFQAKRPGFFPSLCRTMNHIYEVDLYYADALTSGGQGRLVFDREDCLEVAELGQLQMGVDMQFASFCQKITPEVLASEVTTERPGGPVTENVAAVILHLVQHQVHHRGQAHVQLSDAGIAPPQLDEFYLEYVRAESAKAYW